MLSLISAPRLFEKWPYFHAQWHSELFLPAAQVKTSGIYLEFEDSSLASATALLAALITSSFSDKELGRKEAGLK